jgi:hypothetical protein
MVDEAKEGSTEWMREAKEKPWGAKDRRDEVRDSCDKKKD